MCNGMAWAYSGCTHASPLTYLVVTVGRVLVPSPTDHLAAIIVPLESRDFYGDVVRK